MKLPNAECAVVDEAKIVDYLLNPAHRYGAIVPRLITAYPAEIIP